MGNQKNNSNFSMHNVIIRQILAKRSYNTFILMSAVFIIKYIISPINKTLRIYTKKEIPYKFLSHQVSNTTEHCLTLVYVRSIL